MIRSVSGLCESAGATVVTKQLGWVLKWITCISILAWVYQSAISQQLVQPQDLHSAGVYGPGISADGLGNIRIGGPLIIVGDFRFRAEHTGNLQRIRVYVKYDFQRPGYHGGTGGAILVSLQSDDGTSSHLPSGTTLASVLYTDPLNKGNFPALAFSDPPLLRSGEVFHLVFSNPDPQPEVNFVSLNNLFSADPSAPLQPAISDDSYALLHHDSLHPGRWEPFVGNNGEEFTPILEVDYTDGYVSGVGYTDATVSASKDFTGDAKARETFTVSSSSQTVSHLSVRLRRQYGDGSLTMRLEESDGTLVEQGLIAASSVPQAYTWVSYDFSIVRSLIAGQNYNLVLSGPAGTVYSLYTLCKGVAIADPFKNSSFFSDGRAEYSSGLGWLGWDPWGTGPRTDQDLQFFFSQASVFLAIPPPLSPISGSTTDPLPIQMRWGKVRAAENYHYQLALDSTFRSIACSGVTTDTAVQSVSLGPDQTYYMRIRALSSQANSPFCPAVRFRTNSQKKGLEETSPIPRDFNLEQNIPNPFNPQTRIEFSIPQSGMAVVKIFDSSGALVQSLVEAFLDRGTHRIMWDASRFSTGVYYCRLQWGSLSAVRKLLLVK